MSLSTGWVCARLITGSVVYARDSLLTRIVKGSNDTAGRGRGGVAQQQTNKFAYRFSERSPFDVLLVLSSLSFQDYQLAVVSFSNHLIILPVHTPDDSTVSSMERIFGRFYENIKASIKIRLLNTLNLLTVGIINVPVYLCLIRIGLWVLKYLLGVTVVEIRDIPLNASAFVCNIKWNSLFKAVNKMNVIFSAKWWL